MINHHFHYKSVPPGVADDDDDNDDDDDTAAEVQSIDSFPHKIIATLPQIILAS